MNFLRTLGWIVLTVIVVVFSLRNWEATTVNLFGGLVWETKKPIPLLFAFLIGFLPLYFYHRTVRWRLKKRLLIAESAVPAPAVPALTAIVPAEPAPFIASPHGGMVEPL